MAVGFGGNIRFNTAGFHSGAYSHVIVLRPPSEKSKKSIAAES
jgi:hypothetical protein